MKAPDRLVIEEKPARDTPPVLIIDKKGNLGEKILGKLAADLFAVYVSERKPKIDGIKAPGLFYVPFLKKFSQIPENLYSYIFIIDEGEPFINETFDIFIQKAREAKSSLIYITGLRNVSWQFIDKIKGEYKNLKIIIYGDVFGDNWSEDDSLINELIYQAKKDKRIEIPGDGTEKIFPIYSDDLIEEIIKASFAVESQVKLFYLFSPHPQTYLSLAHMLQKTDPDIKIDFIEKEKDDLEIKLLREGVYLINAQYPLSKKLNEVKAVIKEFKKNTRRKDENNTRRNVKFILKYLSLFLPLFILLPLIFTLMFSFLGYLEIKNSVELTKKGFLEKASNTSSLSERLFKAAKVSANGLFFELSLLNQEKRIEPLVVNINASLKLAKAVNRLSLTASSFRKLSTDSNEKSQIESFEPQILIKEAMVLLYEATLENSLPQSYKKQIEDFMNLIDKASFILEGAPDVLGFNSPKTYLILFQNNMELRPGGGFIGSYGILRLNKGKITEFSINDVYDADGQLKGHVEPPFPIRRYLKKPHWFMRDSNFDPDFRQSAYTAAFFLNEEMGQKVDGVIGIDVSFLKILLKEIGPVEVHDYNEVINSENMYLSTQMHAEKDFFPSSTQKKDFLRSLAKAIQVKLSEKKDLPYLYLLRAAFKAAEEKHMLFSFNNINLQNLFVVNGWSSSLWDDRFFVLDQNKQDPLPINDFLAISEANLGVNKANFFIKRTVWEEVSIHEDGSVSSRATVTYINDSDKWPGGDYKNYIRFILPQNASLSQVFINGIPQKIGSAITDPLIYEQKNFIPPQILEVDRTEEEGKTLYGFLVVVPKKSVKKITIDFELPKNTEESPPSIRYSLKYFKQPGTESYPFNFTISIPSSYQIVSSENLNKISDSKAFFSKEISGDLNLVLNLGRK